jgi:radical SAM superfamily enzyme YgiQ (UPF0313 family)
LIDVLITHSYHLAYDHKQLQKMQPYRPLGTLYAAAALRAAGFSVALFDTMLRNPEEEFTAFFEECSPRIMIIYEDDFNFITKMCLTRMRDVAWHLSEVAGSRGTPVIAHGSDASDHCELFLSHGIDYVVRGEAEQTLVELCTAIINRKEATNVAGVVHLDPSGTPVYSDQPLARNPDWIRLPKPPLDLTDFAPYKTAWLDAHQRFSVNMVASRGCPFRCNWCAKPVSANKFQLRPASEVAEEMRELKVEVGAQHIWFSDDVFALNQHWVQELAHEVTARHAALPFNIQSRADLLTDQTVAALKSSGCEEVWMGVESGSQKILDAMDKGLRITSIEDARRRLNHAGIRACFFLQFGYPGEGWPEIQETISLVRRTRPDDIGVSFSYPLPGTVFYDRVRAQLGAKRNWTDSDDLCILFEAAYNTDFYRAIRDALHAEVSSWSAINAAAAESSTPLEQMWERVLSLEPVSRTHNPVPQKQNDTARFAQAKNIVPLHDLLAKAVV